VNADPSRPPELAAAVPSRWRGAIVLLAALASIGLAARLGFWQLDRAAQKLALQATLDARAGEPALAAPGLARRAGEVPAQSFRRVRMTGRWIAERTVFLDNRWMDGKVGFFVVTPLALEASREAVLVQRGWVARNFDSRTVLPALATAPGRVEVEGEVALAPSRMYELGAAASGPIRQNVDPVSFAREAGLDLLPLAVIESATSTNSHDGLERHWPPPATDVQKHYGYAFQWFAIGTVIAFLYVWFRIVRPRQRRRAA
jgi:surfeit locus 1 family protein